ncbi:uncharacterized protein ASCRUDRAFT_83158 [Ascoidea rubescens DSM 1968]|uniref:Uncharacterized protein n=1 Tax=Ascoidea rubescens DSM 1968 TaxID=1344418 RepID=A0A1D2V8A2_9ASCO|nr:hypothetical protein ASCRUDRAFT_83158 [Ascoidea rubescens DSM 1968]ODV57886.1 hypothetical protein ASCRUDRAFT_83158 [Ascoidea rubescens DSM 1968]
MSLEEHSLVDYLEEDVKNKDVKGVTGIKGIKDVQMDVKASVDSRSLIINIILIVF